MASSWIQAVTGCCQFMSISVRKRSTRIYKLIIYTVSPNLHLVTSVVPSPSWLWETPQNIGMSLYIQLPTSQYKEACLSLIPINDNFCDYVRVCGGGEIVVVVSICLFLLHYSRKYMHDVGVRRITSTVTYLQHSLIHLLYDSLVLKIVRQEDTNLKEILN